MPSAAAPSASNVPVGSRPDDHNMKTTFDLPRDVDVTCLLADSDTASRTWAPSPMSLRLRLSPSKTPVGPQPPEPLALPATRISRGSGCSPAGLVFCRLITSPSVSTSTVIADCDALSFSSFSNRSKVETGMFRTIGNHRKRNGRKRKQNAVFQADTFHRCAAGDRFPTQGKGKEIYGEKGKSKRREESGVESSLQNPRYLEISEIL